MNKQTITEEMNLQEEWFKRAHEQTTETLSDFIKHLTQDYQHDYGTICHAISAAALAAIYAVDNSDCGGITGFQAGHIMWEIVREMNYKNNKCGLRILNYDDLLYPQYIGKFTEIGKSTMESVRKQAKQRIADFEKDYKQWKSDREQWEKDIEKFKIDVIEWQKQHPEYPTYSENPKFYERLDCGTAHEWDMEKEKEESGFMFAPKEPCEPTVHHEVLEHWKRLAYDENYVPFGLKIEED